MTDPQHYTDNQDGTRLRLIGLSAGDMSVRTMTAGGSGIDVEVPAEELLAMIDRADPETMRDYLRESSYRDDAEGGMTAAAIEDEADAAPTDPVALVIEARLLIETADMHLRGHDGMIDASQMLSDASDHLRTVINAQLPPEADSPEDVDEQTDAMADAFEAARQIGQILRNVSAGYREGMNR